MRKIGIVVLVAVAAVVAFSSIASAEEIPIEDFEVVEDFPSQIIAGSTYEAHYRFNCTADESILVAMYFVIGGPNIGLGEWFVSATVNGSDVSVLENDENAGNFVLEYEVIARSANDMTIRISSLPNVLPAAYKFTLELWSETVEIIPPEELPPEGENELEPPHELPPEEIPPEKPPTGGRRVRVTDSEHQLAVFAVAIGVLGVAAMLLVRSFISRPKRKRERLRRRFW